MALLWVKWTEALKCQSNQSSAGNWQTSTTKKDHLNFSIFPGGEGPRTPVRQPDQSSGSVAEAAVELAFEVVAVDEHKLATTFNFIK